MPIRFAILQTSCYDIKQLYRTPESSDGQASPSVPTLGATLPASLLPAQILGHVVVVWNHAPLRLAALPVADGIGTRAWQAHAFLPRKQAKRPSRRYLPQYFAVFPTLWPWRTTLIGEQNVAIARHGHNGISTGVA